MNHFSFHSSSSTLLGIEPLVWRNCQISLAVEPEEIREAQRLRHQVFQGEWRGKQTDSDSLDQDEFDQWCDHLLLRDVPSGQLIGTYRFNHSDRCQGWFSQAEFDLADLLTWPDSKVELGRACLHQQWRGRMGMLVIAKALDWYMSACNARWFFGCSSLSITDPVVVRALIDWLRSKGAALAGTDIRARPDWRLPGLGNAVAPLPLRDADAERLLPPLLRFYLRAGAKVLLEPVYDEHFRCVDFLTILDWKAIDPVFRARLTNQG